MGAESTGRRFKGTGAELTQVRDPRAHFTVAKDEERLREEAQSVHGEAEVGAAQRQMRVGLRLLLGGDQPERLPEGADPRDIQIGRASCRERV